jgi:hypothetical protein
VTATDKDNADSSLWRRAWPFAGLAAAVLIKLWIGALGYALIKLLQSGFRGPPVPNSGGSFLELRRARTVSPQHRS